MGISLASLALPASSSEFLINKAVDFYCGTMTDMKPSEMSTYERGLYEGMSIGFIAGQYPEQADVIEKMGEDNFNKAFYPLIKQKCPDKSFETP